MLEGLIVDTNNCLNQVLLVFNSLNRKYFLGFCLIDTFPGHFSFHIINHKTAEVSYASSTYLENYIPVVMPPLNHTSPPSTAATFLATRFMVVLQPSGYSVFHSRDTPIQLSLP